MTHRRTRNTRTLARLRRAHNARVNRTADKVDRDVAFGLTLAEALQKVVPELRGDVAREITRRRREGRKGDLDA